MKFFALLKIEFPVPPFGAGWRLLSGRVDVCAFAESTKNNPELARPS